MFQDGTILSWGRNLNGILGHGDTKIQPIPLSISIPTPIHDISVNEKCAMALDIYGNVYTWGYYAEFIENNNNDDDKEGDFITTFTPKIVLPLHHIKIIQIACGDNFFLAVSKNKYNVFIWGTSCCYNPSSSNHQSLCLTRINGLRYYLFVIFLLLLLYI